MICKLCPNQALYDFGAGQVLCAPCMNAVLDRCNIFREATPAENTTAAISAPVMAAVDPFEIPEKFRRVA